MPKIEKTTKKDYFMVYEMQKGEIDLFYTLGKDLAQFFRTYKHAKIYVFPESFENTEVFCKFLERSAETLRANNKI